MSNETLLVLAIAGAAVWYFGFGPGSTGVSRERVAVSPTIKEVDLDNRSPQPLPNGPTIIHYNRGGKRVYTGEGGTA